MNDSKLYLGADERQVVGKARGRADADFVRPLGEVLLVAELQLAWERSRKVFLMVWYVRELVLRVKLKSCVPGRSCSSLFSEPASSSTFPRSVKAEVGMKSYGFMVDGIT